MSDLNTAPVSAPVSAMNGASFDGLVQVSDCGPMGMITVRGDLASATMAAAVKTACGADMPAQTSVSAGENGQVAWMSPDELLIICDYADAQAKTDALAAALSGEHALAVNVSDARAMFRISGEASREVMAKLCPVDLSPGTFEPGHFRRTRMAQVPAAIWMDDDAFNAVCFRSVGQYAFDLLKTAAAPGSGVGVF